MPFEEGNKLGNRFDSDNQPDKQKVGRKKKPDLIAVLEAALLKEVKEGVTMEDVIINQLMKLAGKGDLRAINSVLDRIHGKPDLRVQTEVTNVTPQILILPPQTDIRPYLNEADVIDPTEQND